MKNEKKIVDAYMKVLRGSVVSEQVEALSEDDVRNMTPEEYEKLCQKVCKNWRDQTMDPDPEFEWAHDVHDIMKKIEPGKHHMHHSDFGYYDCDCGFAYRENEGWD